jgi:hypothetical protein
MVTVIAVASASKFGKPEIGERLLSSLLVTRLRAQGFLVSDWWHRRDEALRRLADWQRAGKLRIKRDILEGDRKHACGLPAAAQRRELWQAACEGFVRPRSEKRLGRSKRVFAAAAISAAARSNQK